MNNVYRFFKRSVFGFVGFFGGKGIFDDIKCNEKEFKTTAGQLVYEYFDCGNNFGLSKSMYCN